MNAAARVINQTTLFNGQLASLEFSRSLLFLLSLIFALLLTGFGIIYSTNAYRNSFSQLQQVRLQTHQLQLQWGQLLLEQASLATPGRVSQLATEKLAMDLPDPKNTFVLRVLAKRS